MAPIWVRKTPKKEAEETAMHFLEKVKIPDQALKYPGQLSGGQQQRVAVARALIGRPPMIVADEPTSALDEGSQSAFLDLMFAQIRQNETTLLMVSHDPRLAERFDRVVELEAIAQIERAAA